MRGVYLPISSVRYLACAAVDYTILVASMVVATWLRFFSNVEELYVYENLPHKAVLSAAVLAVCFYYNDMYEDSALRGGLEGFVRCLRAFVVATVLLLGVYYAVPALQVGRGILSLYLLVSLLGILAWRSAFVWASGKEALSDNVLIVGTGQSARQIAEEIVNNRPVGFRVVGFLGEHRAEVGRRLVQPIVLGTVDDLEEVVRQQRVRIIVVALDDRRGKMPVASLLRCRVAGVSVEEVTGFFERVTGKILVKNLRPSWLVFSQGFSKPRLLRNTKRAAEFVVALIVLTVAAPALGIIAAIIRLDSRGPIFYRQERVGERGQPFNLIKLRTMRVDAEKATGPVWASEGDDPRMTRVGRLLRKLRLDELPQIINVLRGEMSFVGPRPERPHFVEMLRKIIPYYDERHSVMPGITGWAQTRFRYGSTIEDAEEKLQYDLYYVKHMSMFFDLGIVLDTLKVMILGRGAR